MSIEQLAHDLERSRDGHENLNWEGGGWQATPYEIVVSATVRNLIPVCLYDGCTGASVQHKHGARFCSMTCAALYGEQAADIYDWCCLCGEWHSHERDCDVRREAGL